MSRHLSEEVVEAVRELVEHIPKLKRDSEAFANVEKKVTSIILKGDTMSFFNYRDVQREITSMAQKFSFHGFFRHGEKLEDLFVRYVPKSLKGSELGTRLHVVKFLLCTSNRPTTQFWMNPNRFEPILTVNNEEEVLNWGEYLNEGIERWSPVKDDSFDASEQADDGFDELESSALTEGAADCSTVIITESCTVQPVDFQKSREKLLDSIQHSWYNSDKPHLAPPSDLFEANVGILWDQYITAQAQNLVAVEPVGVITEHQAMREIIWQMWGQHNSTLFFLSGNNLLPKPDMTISSVRAPAFERFLRQSFIPHIELLDEFRIFHRKVTEGPWMGLTSELLESYRSYGTCRNYDQALQNIIRPVFLELVRIEDEIRKQEETMTLLKLSCKFERVFAPLVTLRAIHRDVIPPDFNEKPPLELALKLLLRLRSSLRSPFTKVEQDLRLAIYIETIYYYLHVVDAWLVRNSFTDYSQEFIIQNENCEHALNETSTTDNDSEDWKMKFTLRDIPEEIYEKDGIIRIISDQVLQVGRNLHLYRLLGKYDGIVKKDETIHEEFKRKILEELCKYYDVELEKEPEVAVPKIKKRRSSFGDYVDTSDGFLMAAFESYMKHDEQEEEEEEEVEELSLYERISGITRNLFPMRDLPERVLSEILKERFTISGLMVKNLLLEKYVLDEQFELLSHVYLCRDDFLFPFYRRLFDKMESSTNWGNSIWLTSHLHDVIMDQYPNFYEHCVVQVNEQWRSLPSSPEACACVGIRYAIKWPLSIIITSGHVAIYRELFGFILKLKWALYTVNHLSFSDLRASSDSNKATVKKLKYLRFVLINILNSIQHYVFGYVFATCKAKFELDFEKSNDLQSLMTAHSNFIHSLYVDSAEIAKTEGFESVMKCVKLLKKLWHNGDKMSYDRLDDCYKLYKSSYSAINPVVNPVSFMYK